MSKKDNVQILNDHANSIFGLIADHKLATAKSSSGNLFDNIYECCECAANTICKLDNERLDDQTYMNEIFNDCASTFAVVSEMECLIKKFKLLLASTMKSLGECNRNKKNMNSATSNTFVKQPEQNDDEEKDIEKTLKTKQVTTTAIGESEPVTNQDNDNVTTKKSKGKTIAGENTTSESKPVAKKTTKTATTENITSGSKLVAKKTTQDEPVAENVEMPKKITKIATKTAPKTAPKTATKTAPKTTPKTTTTNVTEETTTTVEKETTTNVEEEATPKKTVKADAKKVEPETQEPKPAVSKPKAKAKPKTTTTTTTPTATKTPLKSTTNTVKKTK